MFKKAFLAAVPALLASHSALSADSFSCPASSVTWHSAGATCSTITTQMGDNDVKTFPAQKNGQATIKCSVGKLLVVNASCKSDSSNSTIDPLRVTDLPAAPFVPLPVLAGAGNLQNIHAANDQYSQKVTVIDPDGVSVNEISIMNPAPIQVSPAPVQTHWWDAYVGKSYTWSGPVGNNSYQHVTYTFVVKDVDGSSTLNGQPTRLVEGSTLNLVVGSVPGSTCSSTPPTYLTNLLIDNGGSGIRITPLYTTGPYDPSCGG